MKLRLGAVAPVLGRAARIGLALAAAGCGLGDEAGPTGEAAGDRAEAMAVADAVYLHDMTLAALLVRAEGVPLLVPVGECEGEALLAKLYDGDFSRPLAPDLFRAFADSLGYAVSRIALTLTGPDALAAEIALRGPDGSIVLEGTAGDALAICAALGVEVLAGPEVVDRYAARPPRQEPAGRPRPGAGGVPAGRPAQDTDPPVAMVVLDVQVGYRSVWLLLAEEGGARQLPIHIGPCQGLAIFGLVNGMDFAEVRIYDLLGQLLIRTGTRMTGTRITAVEENVFHARIALEREARQYLFDARPSDAVALALITGARIEVVESVLGVYGGKPQGRPVATGGGGG